MGHTHGAIQGCMKLCKGVQSDVRSQVGIHMCTDACTHSNQGVEPDEGLRGYTHRAIQGTHVCAQQFQGSETDVSNHVCMHTCTDVCTLSNQGVRTEQG